MKVTPRILREVVADTTGRKQHGFLVRVYSAMIFYSVVGGVVGFLGGIWAAGGF